MLCNVAVMKIIMVLKTMIYKVLETVPEERINDIYRASIERKAVIPFNGCYTIANLSLTLYRKRNYEEK